MKDFFHGWRRKAGCVTLVMALAVTGAWVRSNIVEDDLSFLYPDLQSSEGGIEWTFLTWRRELFKGREGNWLVRQVYWRVPYGFVATPLTLLSAYLLLGQPRKPPSAK